MANLFAAMLQQKSLPSDQLLALAQLAESYREPEMLEDFALHPNADLNVWREIARADASIIARSTAVRLNSPEILCQIPEARRDPGIRSFLRKHLEASDVLIALCQDSCADTPEIFQQLAKEYPGAALRLAEDPEFQAAGNIHSDSLLPLLSSTDSEFRLRAILLLPKFTEQTTLDREGERERGKARENNLSKDSSWREKYRSTQLPF